MFLAILQVVNRRTSTWVIFGKAIHIHVGYDAYATNRNTDF
ncbi:hypothetical protein TUN199_03417 [Pyrenophora tritici-repentis]|uniref:Uncharacterized protein n=1 Tax=Pyrenophora tritici-repentis TaxID=45151 RepID=A0A5M9LXX4_9PLEO|nr:hypothetical protein PtrV1_02779 [Pyrenophora tritici-repentis]KAF7578735.1 hypothetical protein PtrM4_029750 [Pyrenophora tritici-repentis]KAI0586406.1 hypothetical protein Alg215_02040 [Pyrenophora tritici-repentis]KAI0588389.1 hypothetical protein Alg130_03409 [Pyrenophora tritici-repentis]KAI0612406.1 hypothetical protein TUN205_03370 [Pyrenophora tritici-repentis]